MTASFLPAIPSVPERSRAAGSKVSKGQDDSKGNMLNEIRTVSTVAGIACKDKCTQINRKSSTELKHNSRKVTAENVQAVFAGHRKQSVSNPVI